MQPKHHINGTKSVRNKEVGMWEEVAPSMSKAAPNPFSTPGAGGSSKRQM